MSQSDRDAIQTTSTFSRRRRRQHSSPQDASSVCSSSPESKRVSDGHLLKVDWSAAAAAESKTTMRRSCAAAVLACNARTKPASDSERLTASDHNGDPLRRLRPTRRTTLSARRRLSENKENIADNEHSHYNKLSDSFGVCKPDIRYPRLFPDLNKVDEEEQSSLVRTSSVVREDLQCQATSTTMTLEDVSAISRTSDGESGVLHRVRSTTSVSSLNGAFCSSSGDAEDDATTAAGAFCSTFSYPLHSTVIDSFFDVSALLPPPPRPLPSPGTANHIMTGGHSPNQRRQLDRHADGSSQNCSRRRSETHGRKDSLHSRLFNDLDRPNLLLNDVSSSCQLADSDQQRPSMTAEQLSPLLTTELDFARTSDANCTARLRRQMGQTRLYTTNSSSSHRQSDFTCSRLNIDDDCSRSTLFECGCSAEQQFQRLPTATTVEYNVPPTSKNFSLSRSHRRYAEQFEPPACFTDTCCSWSSDRRRMTMHCAPTTRSDALFTVKRPIDRHDRYQVIADDQRQTGCRQLRSLPHRQTADERLDRRQRVAAVPRDHVGGGGGCPLCGCGRKSDGEAGARKWSKTSKLTSSNCDDTAAERRRKRALLHKLRRFSDAFYGNTGEVQLKTFGHF